MDGELLQRLYHRLFSDPTLTRTLDCTFPDALILLIYFFAVLSNRSTRWAHNRKNWPLWCRQLTFPSYSQLRRRLRRDSIRHHIHQLNADLRAALPGSSEKAADGKALLVGGFSKDPDARRGKIPNGWGRGYKLHVIIDAIGAIDAFEVTPLSDGEATVMRRLVCTADLHHSILRADANYDSNALYHAVEKTGGRLLAPRRKPGRGLGHLPQHPHRLLAIAELEADPQGLAEHERHRVRVEQGFAHLTNLPFGMWALPNSVRRLHRVRLWITAKIMLYHLYLSLLPRPALAA
jgi:hypothetical protein